MTGPRARSWGTHGALSGQHCPTSDLPGARFTSPDPPGGAAGCLSGASSRHGRGREDVGVVSWVEKLDSGRYRGVYRDADGRRRSRTFERRALATAWLAAEATDRARGQWVDPRDGAVPLDAWAAQWFAVRTVRPTTAASDQGRYDTHLAPTLGEVLIKDITPLRVKALVADLAGRRSPATVRHVHALLSTMLGDAVHEGLLLSNPCARTKLPAPRPPAACFLTPEQIGVLAEVIDPRYRTLLLIAAGTGMRWGELAGL